MPARAGRASSWPTACPPSKTQTASLSSREEWWSNRGRINSCCLRRESTTCWSPNRWATGANKKTELFFSFRRDPTLVPFIANSLLLNVQMPKSLNICSCVFLHLPFSKMTLWHVIVENKNKWVNTLAAHWDTWMLVALVLFPVTQVKMSALKKALSRFLIFV